MQESKGPSYPWKRWWLYGWTAILWIGFVELALGGNPYNVAVHFSETPFPPTRLIFYFFSGGSFKEFPKPNELKSFIKEGKQKGVYIVETVTENQNIPLRDEAASLEAVAIAIDASGRVFGELIKFSKNGRIAPTLTLRPSYKGVFGFDARADGPKVPKREISANPVSQVVTVVPLDLNKQADSEHYRDAVDSATVSPSWDTRALESLKNIARWLLSALAMIAIWLSYLVILALLVTSGIFVWRYVRRINAKIENLEQEIGDLRTQLLTIKKELTQRPAQPLSSAARKTAAPNPAGTSNSNQQENRATGEPTRVSMPGSYPTVAGAATPPAEVKPLTPKEVFVRWCHEQESNLHSVERFAHDLTKSLGEGEAFSVYRDRNDTLTGMRFQATKTEFTDPVEYWAIRWRGEFFLMPKPETTGFREIITPIFESERAPLPKRLQTIQLAKLIQVGDGFEIEAYGSLS